MFARSVLRNARSFVPRSPVQTASRQFATSMRMNARQSMSTALPLIVGAAAVAGTLYLQAKMHPIQAEKKANAGVKDSIKERTYIMIKPDGVQRGLIGEIISRFEKKGYKLVALKLLTPSKELAAKHYDDLKAKPFFKGLVEYISSGTPVVAMVWEGKSVIKTGRKILGATNPADSEVGTIRGDLAVTIGRNLIHGSDSFESANDEIALWFKDEDINDWEPTLYKWINEVN